MLEKVSRLAEQAATNVSRRQFLGRFGRGAMIVAAAAGGALALPGVARAGRPSKLCGEFSGICSGLTTGSACDGREGGPGKCRRIRGSNDCFCDTQGR